MVIGTGLPDLEPETFGASSAAEIPGATPASSGWGIPMIERPRDAEVRQRSTASNMQILSGMSQAEFLHHHFRERQEK
jgi:hypothetical protein